MLACAGYITRTEIVNVMRTMNLSATDEEIDKMIKEVDTDGNGEISFEGMPLPVPLPHALRASGTSPHKHANCEIASVMYYEYFAFKIWKRYT